MHAGSSGVRRRLILVSALAAFAAAATAADGLRAGDPVFALVDGKLVRIGVLVMQPDGTLGVAQAAVHSAPQTPGGEERAAAGPANAAAGTDDRAAAAAKVRRDRLEREAEFTAAGRYPRVYTPYSFTPGDLAETYARSNGGWYGYGYEFPYGAALPPAGDFADTFDQVQRSESRMAARIFNQADMNRRQERLESAHQRTLRQGTELLRSGEYLRAVVALSAAAELDQGDPAARIHLAQARLALGHYGDAARSLRRALQLQPNLAYMDLKLSAYYPRAADFDEDVRDLAAAVQQRDLGGEVDFLLGYLEFQRGDFASAHAAFQRAACSLKRDDLTTTYLDLTKPSERTTAAARGSERPAARPIKRLLHVREISGPD